MEPRPCERPPLSIGLVTPGWPADAFPNGVVTYVRVLVPALRGLGHRVSLLAIQGADVGEPGVYAVARYRANRSLLQRVADRVSHQLAPRATHLRLLRRGLLRGAQAMATGEALDVLELEESFGAPSWIRAALDVPVCVRLHGPWFLNGPVRGGPQDAEFDERVRAEGEAIAAADGISAPSHDVLERVRARYGLDLPDAEVIPYPVEPVAEPDRWSVEGCEPGSVLFVGRFDRHKGGDLVIEAFRRIVRDFPRARLRFVGPDRGCVTDDGRSWTLPEFLREHLPVAREPGRFDWLGPQPPAALAALRRRALVSVIASRYETFCYTAAESMALGCPVVASDVGAIPELIDDGRNGLLFRGEDARDLAEKVLSLLADPRRAVALGSQAALDASRRWNPGTIAARTAELHRRVLGRGVPPSSREPRIRGAKDPVPSERSPSWPSP